MICLSVLLPWVSGCAGWKHPKPQLDSMAGLYDKATLVYRLDASQLCEPLAVARIEGQLVAYQELPSSPVPNSAVGTLTIKYPHPAGVPGCALAEVIIETRQPDGVGDAPNGKKPSKWSVLMSKFEDKKKKERAYEYWTFDLPKAEFDKAIGKLDETGYFGVAKVTQPGVEITAQVDKQSMKTKVWKQVPELDAIMLHVRKSGELVTYRRDPTLTQQARKMVTSVDAYRQVNAATPGATPGNNTPPGLVPPALGVTAPGGPGNAQLSRLPETMR